MTVVVSHPPRPKEVTAGLGARLLRILRSPALKALLAANFIAVAIILLRANGGLQPAELLVYDTLRVAWAGAPSESPVLLVGATEEDITAGKPGGGRRWGWPLRDGALADVLERLALWKPRAIGVDLYRDVPEPPGTERLDAVLQRHPEILWVFKLREDDKHPGIPPPSVLAGSERAVLSDTLPDAGGVVRRGLLFAADGQNQFTALGMSLALAYLAPRKIQLEPAEGDDLRLGKALIHPLDDTRGPYIRLDSSGYQMLLDYRGGPQPFPERSLSAVMDRDDLAAMVRDHIVIVGVDAESVKDFFHTPFSTGFGGGQEINGTALHAHVADQLIRAALNGEALLDGLPRLYEDLWIWGWAVAGALLGLMVRATLPSVAGIATGAAAIGAIVYVAFGRGVLLPALPALGAWIGAGALTNQVLYATVHRARARLRKSFEHYLPPAVIEQLVAKDTLPQLGGERREISVLFTDVAGYTTFSEDREPEELAKITNEYFDGIHAKIFAQEGYVNAYMGDGVLAFFGAPQEQPQHADHAVSAALAIAEFAEHFSAEQQARGVQFGHTRIGVHTGVAFVGNVGAHERLQYSALGDILNTGSRLEGLNKVIGSRICVSREVVEQCRNHRFRPAGQFIVKGRRGATEVYVPIDPERTTPEVLDAYLQAYGCLETAPEEAAERFEALRLEHPDDPCIAFHCARLRRGQRGRLIEMREK